ncbi:MAG: GntG family PLP-dependent aldolase [Candidatus Eisenbacteria bacterium]
MVDLRSDTVTRPTAEMRQVLAEAVVGDDVFGDDPTVRQLEAEVAALLGHEAALFVPSGTMANAVGVAVHTRPGDEVLLEETAHIFQYEGGGSAVLSGVQLWPIRAVSGLPEPGEITARIRPLGDPHLPISRLLCLENTHNRAGGRVLPLDAFRGVIETARSHGLSVHLDGARLWNAAVASGRPESDYARLCDSVSVCFSKGLGAPVGSAFVGSKELVERARLVRKRLGGGMRQVGILAAAALHAVHHHRARLAEDHARARRLAEGIAELPGLDVELETVETNIVVAEVVRGTRDGWLGQLREKGVWAVAFGGNGVRFVTHLDVDDAGIDLALDALRSVRV